MRDAQEPSASPVVREETPEERDFRNVLTVFGCLAGSVLSSYLLNNPYGSYIPIMFIVIYEWYVSFPTDKRSYYGLCRLLLYMGFITFWNVLVLKLCCEGLSCLIGHRIPFKKVEHLFPYALIFTSFARTKQDREVSLVRRVFIHVLYDVPAFLLVIIFKLLNNPLNCLCSEITEHCYLGCLPLPSDVKQLHDKGIERVVNMCAEYGGPKKTYDQYHIKQLHLPTVDTALPSKKTIEKAMKFMKEAMDENKKVFVHCKAGMGRSATVVFCHLIVNENFTPEDALKRLKERRTEITSSIAGCPSVQRFLATQKDHPQ